MEVLFFKLLDFSSEEEEEFADYDEDPLFSPHIEDNGLGLLARFAASVEPSPLLPLANIELEKKQNNDEEKQSFIGECDKMKYLLYISVRHCKPTKGLPNCVKQSNQFMPYCIWLNGKT